MLPDRSVLIGQKLVGNAKIKKLKCDILSNFQTMWMEELDTVHENLENPEADIISFITLEDKCSSAGVCWREVDSLIKNFKTTPF